jgi:hypothetical protein
VVLVLPRVPAMRRPRLDSFPAAGVPASDIQRKGATAAASSAIASYSRAEISGRHPALLTVVASDSRPIRTAPFQDGDRVAIHEAAWGPVVVTGRRAKDNALAVRVGDVRTVTRRNAYRGRRWRNRTAHLRRRLRANQNVRGLSRGRDPEHGRARAALAA